MNLYNSPAQDKIVYEACARVISILLSELSPKEYWINQENFMNQLLTYDDDKKKISDHCRMSCLSNLLRVNSLIAHFFKSNGMSVIADVLQTAKDIQTVYYAFFCLWLISFEDSSLKYFQDAITKILKLMVTSLQSLCREKIIRIGYACFRNLCRDSTCIEILIDHGLLKVTDNILKMVLKDTETIDDIKFVGQTLEKNLKVLTSFEKFAKEINSGVLEWGPVHSERFWRENARKAEENEFSFIKKLIHLLKDSDPKVLLKNQAISCYDLGEFCRFHPFGKTILDKLGAKTEILALIESKDNSVKENALIAIQKIMLNSWQSANISDDK